MASYLFFMLGVFVTYLLSQPGLELLQRSRRQISWRKFQRAVTATLEEVVASGFVPDVVVGLNSGIVPASIIALNLRLSELYFYDCLPRYQGRRRLDGVIHDKGINLAGKKVLLIDDQSYTGRSIEHLQQHLISAALVEPTDIMTHALFAHEGGAGGVALDLPATSEVRGHVKKMPWVISDDLKPFWEHR